MLAIGSRDNFIYVYQVTDGGTKYSRIGRCSVSADGLAGLERASLILTQWGPGMHICIRVLDHHFDGLVQERRNSSALAMELRLSCSNPSICSSNDFLPFYRYLSYMY